MKSFNVYLTFDGTCRQAFEFYKSCLGGEIIMMQTFGESSMEVEEANKDRVMHTIFQSGPIFMMASDLMPGDSLTAGTNYSLSIDFESEEEQQQVFDKLAEGGKVNMALENTFWGARFGMLTDKFGINWMFNYDFPKE